MSDNFFVAREEIIGTMLAQGVIETEVRKSTVLCTEEIYMSGAGGVPCDFRKLRKIIQDEIYLPYIQSNAESFQVPDPSTGDLDWDSKYYDHKKSQFKYGNIAKYHPEQNLKAAFSSVNVYIGEILHAIQHGYSYKDHIDGGYLSQRDLANNKKAWKGAKSPEDAFKDKVKSFQRALDGASPSDILVSEEYLEQVKREIDAKISP